MKALRIHASTAATAAHSAAPSHLLPSLHAPAPAPISTSGPPCLLLPLNISSSLSAPGFPLFPLSSVRGKGGDGEAAGGEAPKRQVVRKVVKWRESTNHCDPVVL